MISGETVRLRVEIGLGDVMDLATVLLCPNHERPLVRRPAGIRVVSRVAEVPRIFE
jgi:hypothetical protein